MFMSTDQDQWIEAGKIKKGTSILIEGKHGPRTVTRREKFNDTHVRVHFTNPTSGAKFYITALLTDWLEIYQGETCKLCTKKYMPQSSCYEGFCGYGCSASHAFITPSSET